MRCWASRPAYIVVPLALRTARSRVVKAVYQLTGVFYIDVVAMIQNQARLGTSRLRQLSRQDAIMCTKCDPAWALIVNRTVSSEIVEKDCPELAGVGRQVQISKPKVEHGLRTCTHSHSEI